MPCCAALLACSNLETLPDNQCGNFVIERGEDCDGAGIGDNVCSATCRLQCSPEGACPAGWGCGQDSICRQASGDLEPFGATVPFQASALFPADFDGDGRTDLLAAQKSSFALIYADPSGLSSLPKAFSIPPLDTSPEVPGAGDIDGDGRADLALRSGEALGIASGRADRALSARLFSRAPENGEGTLLTVAIDPRPEAPFSEVLLITDKDLQLAYTANTSDLPTGPLLTWPDGHAPFSLSPSPLLSQSFFNSPPLAYAFEGSPELFVFAPLVNGPEGALQWNYEGSVVPILKITLPPGTTVTGPVRYLPAAAYDKNNGAPILNNGYAVFIGGTLNGESALFAAYPSGDSFHSRPDLDEALGEVPDGAAGIIHRTSADPGVDAPILDIVLLDNGGQYDVPDLVTEQGVFLSRCPTYPTCVIDYTDDKSAGGHIDFTRRAAPDAGERWIGAHYAYEDLYVFPESSGITVLHSVEDYSDLNNTNNTYFNPIHIPTQSQVRHLAVGDMDGNGNGITQPDVIFSQISARAPLQTPPVESLHVAFSDATTILSAPVDLGDVGQVTSITATPFYGLDKDVIADMLVRAEVDGAPVEYFLPGRSDRQIQAPLDLTAACAPGSAPSGFPAATAIGHFAGEGPAEVAAIYASPTSGGAPAFSFVTMSVTSNASSEVCDTIAGPLEIPALQDAPSDAAVSLIAADLDRDGNDDVLVFDPTTPSLSRGRRDGEQWVWSEVTIGADTIGVSHQSTPEGTFVFLRSDSQITVLGADEDTEFGSDPVVFDVSEVVCGPSDSPAGAPNAAAFLNLDSDSDRELVVWTDVEAIVFDGADGAPACKTSAFGGGARAVAAGDVNGDGLEDVIVARLAGIEVLVSAPVVP